MTYFLLGHDHCVLWQISCFNDNSEQARLYDFLREVIAPKDIPSNSYNYIEYIFQQLVVGKCSPTKDFKPVWKPG